MPPAQEVFIGLGSNLGSPRRHLLFALERLARAPAYAPGAVSSLYRTAPVGRREQPPFYNAVCRGMYERTPHELLRALQALEAARGRQRQERWGPRTLDLDILLFGDMIIEEADLQVPHPRLHERGFVLIPLAELAPSLVLPRWGRTAAQLWQDLPPGQKAGQEVERVSWA
ncbi:MAG: 2-amino-4-hydroxy-6-hydroxymethyldihydropteridine diphosphokinase [Desulfarculus sp.]|jgi:2-amino-4-hydroxy-6-hydroxymethyldihydropteridine diphosphokinase|nr:MAG: 2-amino-4-hydroxy-6-hydroxymethyldihydropteridine diphosphokinase [Desulfarculus sp.]